ncbi:hypothetical protein C8F01DRAFT_657182 [Mycena amicta]|nr:hypothetical protein C8F01DRAFT_657182 [Mycena amicta]
MQVENARGQVYRTHGRSGIVDGRHTNLYIPRALDLTKTILTITSIGRDDPTTAEAQRAATVLSILQGRIALLSDNIWIKNIWLPPSKEDIGLQWPPTWSKVPPPTTAKSEEDNLDRLNASQRQAAEAMLDPKDENRFVLIQGPPGTGKTSVIAAYVKTAIQQNQLVGCNRVYRLAATGIERFFT